MPKPISILCGVLALLLAAAAAAGERIDPYTAEVTVAGQDAEAQVQAQRAALAEVLVRVTGDRKAPLHPALQPLLKDAARYVQQFRYLGGGELAAEPHLWVHFDGTALSRALQEAGMRQWGELRPTVVAWVAVQGEGRRELLGGEQGGAEQARMRSVAERRGLPLVLPLLDLEDQRAIRYADVWGGFLESAASASQRYQADIVLLGRLYRAAEGGWAAEWRMTMEGGEQGRWLGRGPEPAALAAEAVDELADRLAGRYAVGGATALGGAFPLVVRGVRRLADYARVEGYLSGLNGVEAVRLERVTPDALHYQVVSGSGREALAQLIALGRVLIPGEGAGTAALDYRLAP